MGDQYTELLVKKRPSVQDQIKKYGLILLTAAAAAGGLFLNPLLLIVAVALGVACYFVLPRLDLEYEYLFVNGEMDVDKVMAKSRRKRAKSFSIREAEIVAPVSSHRLDAFRSMRDLKTLDYSSGNPSADRLAVIVREEKAIFRIILEPDEKLAQMMFQCAPSKVFLKD